MKFGKQIQRRQLELPEYAASFTNYKALKKLIKQLSASPTIPPASSGLSRTLRANKDVFFFRLERELDKVNAFYLQKEDEFTLRLKTLLDRKRVVQSKRAAVYAPTPLSYAALFEGVQQFDGDLNKLQQFVEINETAVSKILKKWDKTSKSRTKELYLQRAVEVQPCFNREKLRDLSDRATAAKLELEAWAEGENIQYSITTAAGAASAAGAINGTASVVSTASGGTINGDDELQMLVNAASASGNEQPLRDHLARLKTAADEQSPVVAANETVTRIFLTAIADAAASDAAVMLLLQSGLVDLAAIDDINRRDTLHEAVISGRTPVFSAVLAQGVEPTRADVYGRLPLHYACMHGRVEMVTALLETTAGSATIDVADHDNFTPLIHSIVRDDLACIEQLVAHHAKVDPPDDDDSGGYHQIPLSLACKHASLLAVRLLLSRGAHILADAEGLYPQHIVARGGRALAPELLLVLCEHGADLDQRDRLYQWTPLFHAAAEGCVACLRTLLECGVDAATVDEKGLSAMYYAAWEGHLECMAVLWKIQEARGGNRMPPTADTQPATAAVMPTITSPAPSSSERALTPMEVDGIPDLSLPPPIIPIRHYGHNFLDTKALIQISFDAPDPIVFYQPGRYAAARLVVSSRTADFIPRNVLLPILADDARMLPFHVSVGGGDNNDNGDRVTAAGLAHFALDFDLFPTFGSRPIARTAALPDVFVHVANSRAGACSLPLFDPRLRTIGELRFRFAVIQPYAGTPLEISHFATYWKATAAAAAARDYDREREIAGASGTTATAVAMDAAVTGSSLSGNHVRLYVQMTRDHVPVLYPRFVISYAGLALPVCRLTFAEFERVRPPGVAAAAGLPPAADGDPANSSPSAVTESLLRVAVARLSPTDLPTAHAFLATTHLPLAGVLAHLPASININLHAVYPATAADERVAGLEPVPDVNVFADGMLTDLFAHARAAKAAADDGGSDNSSRAQGVGQSQAGLDRHFVRAVVLSSYCADVCVALNWKQPNYPVLLCNDLGQDRVPANRDPVTTCASPSIIDADGRASMSVKDSARIGRENNLMGLVCRASLLDAMPALVHTVKTQGLVLVADCADEDITPSSGVGGNPAAVSSNGPTPSALAYPATDPLMPALAPVSTPAAASTPPPARPKTIAETLAAARAAREAAGSGTIGVAGLRPSPVSTHTPASGSRPESRSGVAAQRSPGSNEQAFRMPEGVNGVVRKTGVLRFHDTIDM